MHRCVNVWCVRGGSRCRIQHYLHSTVYSERKVHWDAGCILLLMWFNPSICAHWEIVSGCRRHPLQGPQRFSGSKGQKWAPHELTRGPPGFTETCIQAPKGKTAVCSLPSSLSSPTSTHCGTVWACFLGSSTDKMCIFEFPSYRSSHRPQPRCSFTFKPWSFWKVSTRSCSLVFFLYLKLSRFQQLLKYRSVNLNFVIKHCSKLILKS